MTSRTDTRDRLLDAASHLFYSEGITATGVDKVVAASGVSKPTLYAHFRSKDELVAAVLERRHRARVAAIDEWVRLQTDDPGEQMLAVFDWLGEWHATQGPRGCAFVNALAEMTSPTHPGREVVQRHKATLRDYLSGLASEAGIPDPERVGGDLLLLIEGANTRMLVDADLQAAARARRIAESLLEAR